MYRVIGKDRCVDAGDSGDLEAKLLHVLCIDMLSHSYEASNALN